MSLPKLEGLDLEEFRSWDAKTQEKVAGLLQHALEGKRRAWFCKRGRTCDGKPHKGFEHPHARADQWPPKGADWFVWLITSGRGAGKTRTASEWTRKISEKVPRIAMVGRRGPDVRGTMVEGRSGLIAVCESAGIDYEWFPSRKEFVFGNGARAYGYSAEEPDTLRGPEHGAAWLDEPAHMPAIKEVWDNLLLGLRIDGLPGGAKAICTTTPINIPWIKELRDNPTTRHTRVSTYQNLENLDPQFRRNIIERYEGTRIGRQELYGEILEDVEGALWTLSMIEGDRDLTISPLEMDRILVSIDPSGTESKKRDEVGIVVVGRAGSHYYVLADYSGHYSPDGWAKKAWAAYDEFNADAVVAEKNYGGEMVRSTLTHAREGGNVRLVNSRRGKELRAEPVVALYEQHRVHHTATFATLEDQQTSWVPGVGSSPDRVDALVHGITELGGGPKQASLASPTSLEVPTLAEQAHLMNPALARYLEGLVST